MFKGFALVSGEFVGRVASLVGEFIGISEDCYMGQWNEFFTVVQGSARVLPLKVVDSCTYDYLDFTSATEISVIFKTNDPANPLLTKTKTSGAVALGSQLGKLTVALSEADTALLAIQDAGDFQLTAAFPAAPTTVIVPFLGALTVLPAIGTSC